MQQRTIEEATTACGGGFEEVSCFIGTDTLSKKKQHHHMMHT
jgi:hypothetical protein